MRLALMLLKAMRVGGGVRNEELRRMGARSVIFCEYAKVAVFSSEMDGSEIPVRRFQCEREKVVNNYYYYTQIFTITSE